MIETEIHHGNFIKLVWIINEIWTFLREIKIQCRQFSRKALKVAGCNQPHFKVFARFQKLT